LVYYEGVAECYFNSQSNTCPIVPSGLPTMH
jgi:hypothetical protein